LKGEFYTTNIAIDEIRSSQSKNIFEIFRAQHQVTVLDPKATYIHLVEQVSQQIGQLKLSSIDYSVLALATMLNEDDEVLILSDDYGLRNVAHELKLSSRGVKTKGGDQLRKYKYVCTACNSMVNERVAECDNCGNISFKRKRR
ncbi:MAG: hypothetical protein ACW99A_15975, partial [Candidatus Kariarchaeaceae archaeon]